jgi:hypothetical protein
MSLKLQSKKDVSKAVEQIINRTKLDVQLVFNVLDKYLPYFEQFFDEQSIDFESVSVGGEHTEITIGLDVQPDDDWKHNAEQLILHFQDWLHTQPDVLSDIQGRSPPNT